MAMQLSSLATYQIQSASLPARVGAEHGINQGCDMNVVDNILYNKLITRDVGMDALLLI